MNLRACMLVCVVAVATIAPSNAARISDLLRKQPRTCPVVKEVIKEVPVLQECPTAEETAAIPNDPRAARVPGQIGFTVELADDSSIGHKGPIPFSKVITISEEMLIPVIGSFYCPDDGVYMVYWSIQAPYGRAQAGLGFQGTLVKYGPLTKDMDSRPSGTTTMASVLQCTMDAVFWVGGLVWPDEAGCMELEGVYTSISGFKIFSSTDGAASAFTAELSQDNTTDHLIYDDVLLNIGNDYDAANGEYICPRTGVYVFTVSQHLLINSSSQGGHMEIRRNGFDVCRPTLARCAKSGSEIDDTGTSTGSCVLECNAGSSIKVYTTSPDRTHRARTSSFSGFLLDSQRAFHAKMADTGNQYLDGQTMKFENVVTNVGGRYFLNGGSYVCDDDDLYLFYAHVALFPETDNRSGEVRFVSAKDGQATEIKRGPRTNEITGGTIGDLASMQVVVRCQPDMAVYVVAVISEGVQSYNPNYAAFGGFKLPSE